MISHESKRCAVHECMNVVRSVLLYLGCALVRLLQLPLALELGALLPLLVEALAAELRARVLEGGRVLPYRGPHDLQTDSAGRW